MSWYCVCMCVRGAKFHMGDICPAFRESERIIVILALVVSLATEIQNNSYATLVVFLGVDISFDEPFLLKYHDLYDCKLDFLCIHHSSTVPITRLQPSLHKFSKDPPSHCPTLCPPPPAKFNSVDNKISFDHFFCSQTMFLYIPHVK